MSTRVDSALTDEVGPRHGEPRQFGPHQFGPHQFGPHQAGPHVGSIHIGPGLPDRTASGAIVRGAAGARRTIAWPYASGIVVYHVAALFALLPWCFTWTGVALAVLGLYVFGTLGINLAYHRLLTHRGLVCPKWLERSFVVLGVCCVQDTPARWVAVHRLHHQHSDDAADPHSPLGSFLWGHMRWLMVDDPALMKLRIYDRYAKDILADRFYRALERQWRWVHIVLASWVVFFGAGFIGEMLAGGSASEALRVGVSLLVWGVFVRTVLVWHITWSVNSLAHVWGSQRYATGDSSRNNWFVGVVSNGEGWHNNHHADPRSARHGHVWWELDVTWLTIRVLGALGLARRIATPRPEVLARAERLGG
jgi:stearoyl-CoA desaturase (delta-9 desaturase)